jgi:hypothetical protein
LIWALLREIDPSRVFPYRERIPPRKKASSRSRFSSDRLGM